MDKTYNLIFSIFIIVGTYHTSSGTEIASPWMWIKGCRSIRGEVTSFNITDNGPGACFRRCSTNTTVIALKGFACSCRPESKVSDIPFSFNGCEKQSCTFEKSPCGSNTQGAWFLYEKADTADLEVLHQEVPSNITGCVSVSAAVGIFHYTVQQCNTSSNWLCYNPANKRCNTDIYKPVSWPEMALSKCHHKNIVDNFKVTDHCRSEFKFPNQHFWIGLFRTTLKVKTPTTIAQPTTERTTVIFTHTTKVISTNWTTAQTTTHHPTSPQTFTSIQTQTNLKPSQTYPGTVTNVTINVHSTKSTTAPTQTFTRSKPTDTLKTTAPTQTFTRSKPTDTLKTTAPTQTFTRSKPTDTLKTTAPIQTFTRSKPTDTLKTMSTVATPKTTPHSMIEDTSTMNVMNMYNNQVQDDSRQYGISGEHIKIYVLSLGGSLVLLICIVIVLLGGIVNVLRGMRRDILINKLLHQQSGNKQYSRKRRKRQNRTTVLTDDNMYISEDNLGFYHDNESSASTPPILHRAQPSEAHHGSQHQPLYGRVKRTTYGGPSLLHSGLTATGRPAVEPNIYQETSMVN